MDETLGDDDDSVRLVVVVLDGSTLDSVMSEAVVIELVFCSVSLVELEDSELVELVASAVDEVTSRLVVCVSPALEVDSSVLLRFVLVLSSLDAAVLASDVLDICVLVVSIDSLLSVLEIPSLDSVEEDSESSLLNDVVVEATSTVKELVELEGTLVASSEELADVDSGPSLVSLSKSVDDVVLSDLGPIEADVLSLDELESLLDSVVELVRMSSLVKGLTASLVLEVGV